MLFSSSSISCISLTWQILLEDMLGTVGHEKEVEALANSGLREAKRSKAPDTIEYLGRVVHVHSVIAILKPLERVRRESESIRQGTALILSLLLLFFSFTRAVVFAVFVSALFHVLLVSFVVTSSANSSFCHQNTPVFNNICPNWQGNNHGAIF